MKYLSFKIYGLDCADDVAILKKEIIPILGDEEKLSFDIINGKMTVHSESEDKLIVNQIRKSVKKTGMKAILWEDVQSEKDMNRNLWHDKAQMCVLSGIFISLGFVIHGILHGFMQAVTGGESGFPVISQISYLLAIITGGWYIAPKALYAIRNMRADMNLLMTIAVIGATLINEWFEAATVTFLFSFALLLESWSIGRTRRAIKELIDQTPATARYICPCDGNILEKPVESVPIGVIALVRPGEKIPLDGVVTKGITSINQAPITGESVPVAKEIGDPVFAGTINQEGSFEFEVTKISSDSTYAKIIRLVEDAQSKQAPSEQWVDKFARYYTPIMLILAVLIFVIPPLFMQGAWAQSFYQALVMLVIACPCALVISTPISIVAGLASSAKAGILIKGGSFLESPANIKAVVFDKTGTLTHGQFTLQKIVPFNNYTAEELLAIAASLESNSEHPLARVILAEAQNRKINFLPSQEFRAIKGKGAEAKIENTKFWIGNQRLIREKNLATSDFLRVADKLENAGHTLIAIANEQHVCGLISAADTIREEAKSIVKSLKNVGVKKVFMLTGDNEKTANVVAQEINLDEFKSGLLPEDKVDKIKSIKNDYKCVAMIGDGINDAPAIAAANVGIAMGAAGVDAAIETADISLMSDNLSKLPWLIQHSRRVSNTIKTNIALALGLKALFIILAIANIASLWMAIAADMGASLLVIFNALKLLFTHNTK